MAEKGQERVVLRGNTWRNIRTECPWGELGRLSARRKPITTRARFAQSATRS
ncbi:hypothetical protein IG631_02479 [Alternaria alternata]|nr:hypothetical protein IG631_02479 [Alternaria alternata]